MDRRQKKTREAIFQAFTELLAEKHYNQISVQDIIDRADIGRTTFYAHFETKDYLLKDLCEELFGHIIDTAMGLPHRHYHHSSCSDTDSVFLHLLRHLQENDRNILELLSSQNNEIFLRYFKSNLKNETPRSRSMPSTPEIFSERNTSAISQKFACTSVTFSL